MSSVTYKDKNAKPTKVWKAVYGKKSFLSKESDTKILQSIYFA